MSEAPPPALSVVVLAWDQLHYTRRCVDSLRRNTSVPFELLIVDNGSAAEARSYAEQAADVSVLNDVNGGFAAGMNQGLSVARGRAVAFLNNDTEVPPGWAEGLLEVLATVPQAGIVVPAVTEARNARTVRTAPGAAVELIDPFDHPPSAVCYVMDTEVARALEGWGEEYVIASGEDIDLAFKVWVNDLEIVFDQRVLVAHVGKGTAAVKLPNWREVWNANARRMLDKWTDPAVDIPRLATCPPDRFERNRRTAVAVAGWMQRYYGLRENSFPGKRHVRRLLSLVRRATVGVRKRAGQRRGA